MLGFHFASNHIADPGLPTAASPSRSSRLGGESVHPWGEVDGRLVREQRMQGAEIMAKSSPNSSVLARLALWE